jgi:serine/threonine-protein kinase
MARHDKGVKDLKSKIKLAKNLSDTVDSGGRPRGERFIFDGWSRSSMLTPRLTERRAMGVVYLGKDPKIGRVVAISTRR